MSETRTPPVLCPFCGSLLDAVTAFSDARPRPGDFSICSYCAGLLTFDATQRPVKPILGDYEAACGRDATLGPRIARGRLAVLMAPLPARKLGPPS